MIGGWPSIVGIAGDYRCTVLGEEVLPVLFFQCLDIKVLFVCLS